MGGGERGPRRRSREDEENKEDEQWEEGEGEGGTRDPGNPAAYRNRRETFAKSLLSPLGPLQCKH